MKKIISLLTSLFMVMCLMVGCESEKELSQEEVNALNNEMQAFLESSYYEPNIQNELLQLDGLCDPTLSRDEKLQFGEKITDEFLQDMFWSISDDVKETNVFTKENDGVVIGVCYDYTSGYVTVYGMCMYDIYEETLDVCVMNDYICNLDEFMNEISK